jgi:DNA polymerase-3 subunit epsilon/CBS domain-containing protein
MPIGSSATPLLALDAVVVDTETTGLDARKARIVEIALVPIVAGRLNAEAAHRRLLRPDVPIPAEATRIHGIDAAAVADAMTFAECWGELARLMGDRIVIGHSVGFDIAVLERECERAGLAWTRPRTLDTRLLAEIVAPNLPGYSLEDLANWLGVEADGRHSAVGDARSAARVFLALLPRLREAGIRTLAEAERACAALTEALETQRRAGWAEPVQDTARLEPARAVARIDSYPYRHRVRDVMSAPARFVSADASLAEALGRMAGERVSSLFVRFDAGAQLPLPADTGIVTERDVMRMLAKGGAEALRAPAGGAASRPLAVVPAEAFAFLAMARMNRLRIRHLGVTDAAGHIVGALSARDLLRLRAEEALELGDAIEAAGDVHDLGKAWARLPRVAASLLAEGLSGRDIAALVSHQVRALTGRAAALAEQHLAAEGRGPAPCPYALAVLGSAGRGESLLAMDQDNALIFSDTDDPAADAWFAALGTHVADILHAVGVPYCKGGVMARNPQWRGTLTQWRERVGHWIGRSKPSDLLSVDIFFDLAGVHGEMALAERIWREAFDAARGQAAFAKLLVESAGAVEPALGLFGGFRTDRGRLDVKKSGLFGLVTAARALAICHHVVERSTPARLAGIEALGRGGQDLEALAEAQAILLDLLAAQQLADLAAGIPPSNAIEVKRLERRDRERLRTALKAVAHLEELTRDLLFGP